MKKEYIYLFLLFFFSFIIQFFIADRVIFGDDYLFSTFAKEKLFFYYENAHPPLPVWIDIVLTSFFGISDRTIRLTSIIFAVGTIALVYFIAKKIASSRVACIAALLTAISAWHIRASQMNSTSDGGMFTFFFYLTLYFFILYLEKNSFSYIVYTGIAAGLTLLTRETGVLLFPILFIFYIINNYNNPTQCIKTCSFIFLFSLLIFSIYPILDLTLNNGNMLHTLFQRVDTAVIQERQSSTPSLLFFNSIFKILIWIGPIFLFFSLLWFKQKKLNTLWVVTLSIVILFYFTVTPSNLDRARYLMVLIPALAILSAEIIDSLTTTFQKKQWVAVGILAPLFFILFILLNNTHIVSYESPQNPLVQLKNGNFDFSIPVFTETDNSGFLLNFRIFVITYLSSVILFIILFFSKENMLKTIAVVLFIAISLGYNLIVVEEYALHWTSPNYSDGIKELVNYGQEHTLKQPLYVLKNYELQYYLGDNYTAFVTTYGLSDTDPEKIAQFQQEINNAGGTILFTDMPPVDREGLLWQAINTCRKDLTIIDKGIEIGYVFTCEAKTE